jgi:hypothetical protein
MAMAFGNVIAAPDAGIERYLKILVNVIDAVDMLSDRPSLTARLQLLLDATERHNAVLAELDVRAQALADRSAALDQREQAVAAAEKGAAERLAENERAAKDLERRETVLTAAKTEWNALVSEVRQSYGQAA